VVAYTSARDRLHRNRCSHYEEKMLVSWHVGHAHQ
jgi:hypothetical protein